ncbi:peptide-methionine (S)-S-oxide reductase MsrA [Candidatus Woesearchaeota archaeon]|nr:peptide-methionine (S)-S-oxide reductase MsrA [Candidatus Woesearchaeota archaeon]
MNKQLATFAAGCFWGVQALFDAIPGVLSTRVGYTGGLTKNPTYEDVCSDATGHAEALEITFDPDKVSYEQLLKIFWENHDPTQMNRQGPDEGTQYRSAIFYHSDAQKSIAEKSKEQLQSRASKTIVTQIVKASTFYPAEDYHQKYLEKRGKKVCH